MKVNPLRHAHIQFPKSQLSHRKCTLNINIIRADREYFSERVFGFGFVDFFLEGRPFGPWVSESVFAEIQK